MKTATLIAAASALLAVAGAQPHGEISSHSHSHGRMSLLSAQAIQYISANYHIGHHRHLAKHVKREVVTLVETVYVQATAAPQVIVYVDQNGKPISTTTEQPVTLQTQVVPAPAANTPQPAPAAVDYSNNREQEPAPIPVATAAPAGALAIAVADYKPPASVKEAPAPAAKENVVSDSVGKNPSGGNGFGITYSPYNSDGTCKSANQVNTDFDKLGGQFSYVRTYGVDCDTVPNVLAAAKRHGMKLFQGIFDIGDLDNAVNKIVHAVGSDWNHIHTISVGNELVQGGKSPSEVMAAVARGRSMLRNAGYNGPVVTVDTLVAAVNHPELCNESDYCAVNSHPFFDPHTTAGQAGAFLTTQIGNLKNALANKDQTILIAEAGWPSKGDTNGQAVPSPENQATAVSAIKSAFNGQESNLVLFNPYNMHWKTSRADQFNAEPWWGFLGECPSG